jgi:NAD(P)-dependent dehydrogenase (short-subunit alcohol dehydrogenase family)
LAAIAHPAVVTGGAHGIGRAIARGLESVAENLVIVDLDAAAAEILASELGGKAYAVDVSNEQQLAGMIETIERDIGPIDLFVSNAGVGFGDGATGAASRDGSLGEIDDRWVTSFNVNLMAHVYAARVLVPRMIARGGGFLANTASAAGLLNQVGDAAYTASKHAAVAFAESLAITHGDDGIKVSVLCPQAVATRMLGVADDSNDEGTGFGGNDVDGVLAPETVAKALLDGIQQGRFLILPHPQVATYLKRKASDTDRWIAGMQRFRKRALGPAE